MAVGIDYGTVEHLVISLGSGNDTFTIESTHGAATPVFLEETFLNTGAGTDTIHINDVTDMLFVNGEDDADTINVNGTGVGSASTINGDDGDDIVNVYEVVGTVTVNGGAGADTVNIYDVTDVLVVNGQAGGDTINVYGTGAGSTSTLNGDEGDDIFNIRAMNGPVDVRGGAGSDIVNVASLAPTLPAGPRTTPTGSIDAINAPLDVDGGIGTLDVLNVDDSAAATSNNKTGTLTAISLTGLELDAGISYANLDDAEHLARVRQQRVHDQRHASDDRDHPVHGAGHRHGRHQRCRRAADRERRAGRRHLQRARDEPRQQGAPQRPGRRRHVQPERPAPCAARGYDVGQGRLDLRIGRAGRRCRVRRRQRRRLRRTRRTRLAP